MATTPTPAPQVPATTPVPAAPAASTTLSPTRRRTVRPAPPARVMYTRHATAGDSDDRIISNALNVFYKIMAWGGGIAILIWVLFGGFKWGQASAPAPVSRPPVSAATIPQPLRVEVVQPSTTRWSSRDECEYHYKVVLHETPAGRCQ